MATSPERVRLTTLSHGAGCACKISAADLREALRGLPEPADSELLVGAATADDAAVYRLRPDLAIVQSADFFTPIVDDPYDFGRIAAANAMSDIYAMGAEPMLALNLVAFSLAEHGHEILGEILRGGQEIAEQAGVAIGGGHSIDDPEPKYGMSVTGTVHPDAVVTNGGGRSGDQLHLTKPIGGGLVTTAAKRGLADETLVAHAIATMTELNAEASRAAVAAGANAMTDVTGFGLLGHLHELCAASGVAARVEATAVPAMEGTEGLAADERCIAGGSRRNAADADSFSTFAGSVPAERRVLLTDAMTSGGLLVAVSPQRSSETPGVRVGELVEGPPGDIRVE
ncbi:MAG: selenide, water dikinase SelD [Solirubrobacterales bacterium]